MVMKDLTDLLATKNGANASIMHVQFSASLQCKEQTRLFKDPEFPVESVDRI